MVILVMNLYFLRCLEKLLEEGLPDLLNEALGTHSEGDQSVLLSLSICATCRSRMRKKKLLSFQTPELCALSEVMKKALYTVAVQVFNKSTIGWCPGVKVVRCVGAVFVSKGQLEVSVQTSHRKRQCTSPWESSDSCLLKLQANVWHI